MAFSHQCREETPCSNVWRFIPGRKEKRRRIPTLGHFSPWSEHWFDGISGDRRAGSGVLERDSIHHVRPGAWSASALVQRVHSSSPTKVYPHHHGDHRFAHAFSMPLMMRTCRQGARQE